MGEANHYSSLCQRGDVFRGVEERPLVAPSRSVSRTSHSMETPGQTQDTPESLCLWERLGIPQEELGIEKSGLTFSPCCHCSPHQEKWKE